MPRICNASIVTEAAVLSPAHVIWEGGSIREVGAGSPPGGMRPEDVDLAGDWLFPGFLDLHFHGCLGHDLMEMDGAHWREASRFLASRGVTGFLATSCSSPREELDRLLEFARSAAGDGAALLGVHLEGPYLNAALCGMHPATQCRAPDPAEYESWLATGMVKRITAALELPGGDRLAAACREGGVLLSLGHSVCDADEVRRWAQAGLRHTTHLYNAMSWAAKPGPVRVCGCVEGVLAEPRVAGEIILDGNHVPEAFFRIARLCKGAQGLTLASDATPFTGLPAREGAVLRYGGGVGQEARIIAGRAVSPDGRVLVGSIETLGDMLPRALAWCEGDAPAVARMLSTNAADLLGRSDLGRIAPGCAADLVRVVRPTGQVRSVWRAGEAV